MRETIVHELVHALQDQNLGLESRRREAMQAYSDGNEDRATALRALWEGEAVFVTWQFRKSTGEDQESQAEVRFDQWLQTKRKIENGRRRAWGCPLRMVEYLNFPYVQGALFVQKTFDAKGWKGVDQLWSQPPTSSREIISDGKTEFKPTVVRFDPAHGILNDGKCVWVQTMGSQGLLEYLYGFIGESSAHAVVEGWRGDRFEFWKGNDGTWKALLACVEFDNSQEAASFSKAFAITQMHRFPIESVLQADEKVQWLQTSRDSQCTYLEVSGNHVWVIEGLDPSKTSAVREAVLVESPS
jgi:hypothetical protein